MERSFISGWLWRILQSSALFWRAPRAWEPANKTLEVAIQVKKTSRQLRRGPRRFGLIAMAVHGHRVAADKEGRQTGSCYYLVQASAFQGIGRPDPRTDGWMQLGLQDHHTSPWGRR
ncbi:hypothetical protein NDU88_003258 [Pleurodeles waltl]|uniref:Secreted protein n=1 Tax=Pleurodeles waltl TaxID=8319 RepID=A0AAV7MRR1_PLEWA|nr:hypothetical protein NDU88_003258 [Pleurodeles waltl]